MFDRRRFLAASSALLAGAALPGGTRADTPGTGRLIWGYPVESGGGRLATTVLPLLARVGGPRLELAHMEGRNTRVASEAARNAAPDGQTILQAQSTSMCVLPHIYRKLGYDPVNDFIPLATMGDFPFVLVLGSAVPESVTSVSQYLDWVSDNPDYRDIGFSIYGSQGHLATLILARSKSQALRPAPYQSSTAMLKDLKNKDIAAGICAAGTVPAPLWASGAARPLAVTTARRSHYLPQVATFSEQGISEMDLDAWYAWFVPAKTPGQIVDGLIRNIQAVQQQPEYAAAQQRLMLTQVSLPPEQIRERIVQRSAYYAQLVKQYQIAPLE